MQGMTRKVVFFFATDEISYAEWAYRATDGLRFVHVPPVTISATWSHSTRSAAPTLIPATDTHMRGNVADLGRILKAVKGVQRVAHMALVRVQTRNDDAA